MVFSSLSFLVVFLPVLLAAYFAVPKAWKHARQYVLLAFSLCFYGAGEPLYIFLILGCISLSFVLSGWIRERCRWALVAALLVNIVPLVVTKYAGFIAENVGLLFGGGADGFRMPRIVMPIGISFYTFQVITYLTDLYQGKVERQANPLLFALYIMFFPQLIAGPIVKYAEVARELENPDASWKNAKYGAGRFVMGLGKKVLIANQAGFVASSLQACGTGALTTGMAWLCVLAYTIQIYFDFSGYSEMAIGLGGIFGFHFPENFNDPYTSRSATEFWRRWHMTLGRFFREYVYIPLGGNRVGRARWILNIAIVWALTGLWHGASWNFVVWGLYYGVLIVAEKTTGISGKLPKPLGWLLTLFAVMVGWAIFMCDTVPLKEMLRFVGRLFAAGEAVNPATVSSLRLWENLPFLVVGFAVSTPAWVWARERIAAWRNKDHVLLNVVSDSYLILVLLLSLVFLLGGTYNPFIYFRF